MLEDLQTNICTELKELEYYQKKVKEREETILHMQEAIVELERICDVDERND